jgi:hypothetical protein
MQKQEFGQVSKVVSISDGLTVCCDLTDLMCVFWLILDEAGRDILFGVSDCSVWAMSWDRCILVFNKTELVD